MDLRPTPSQLAVRARKAAVDALVAPPEPAVAVLRARSVGTRIVVWALVARGDGFQVTESGTVDLDLAAPGLPREPSPQCAAASVTLPQILPVLRELAAPSRSCVLVVTNEFVRAMLLGATDLLSPTVHVAPGGHWPGSEAAEERATAIVDQMATFASTPVVQHAGSVVVATDASMRSRHGFAMAGCAWVREDLMCETESWAAGDMVTAELHSIHMALRAHRRTEGRLVIESDSMAAIALAKAARVGDITASTERLRRIQRAIAELEMTPRVQIRWVRGHDGNPLNELADRLAVLTRLDDDAGISAAEHTRRVAGVIADAHAGVDLQTLPAAG